MTSTEKLIVSNRVKPASVATTPNSRAKGMITSENGAALIRPRRNARQAAAGGGAAAGDSAGLLLDGAMRSA